MSCDYDVCCLDCLQAGKPGAHLGLSDLNHQRDLCAKLVHLAPAFVAMHHAMVASNISGDEVRVQVWYDHSLSVAWFADHAGHRLGVIDEYGRAADLCGESVRCGCGAGFHCVLDRGHPDAECHCCDQVFTGTHNAPDDCIKLLQDRVRECLAEHVRLRQRIEGLKLREPTQAEGDAAEGGTHADGKTFPAGECFVAEGGWTGRRCFRCREWAWGGPTSCRVCATVLP